ncbi:N-acetylmuramate alpha-1-phosphate uridylyltransferase MurU [Kangiella sediminilitoris]|uniref:Mannose-1-phosphate guanylyltransferase n=1 Tax=Kangiella sediminilitoris TaxID=1144748 RepID=A0A1B3B8M2_9GAMM|nr:nucleotidyltransferase family protein [Kangiella sediminilitoris]AOE49120.1 mannose-1-phosphate guanylyltransferase [Kangiella sediminilitoris]
MKAMILAAGRGERMRPLTDRHPKPLLKVDGRALIEWHIEALKEAGINEILINTSWLGDQIPEYLGDGGYWGVNLTFSHEPNALETAGGIRKALDFFDDEPFIVVSGDVWSEYNYEQLLSQPTKSAHIVLAPNPEHHPEGDFQLRDDNLVIAEGDDKYTFSGIGVYHPKVFADVPLGEPYPLAPLLRELMVEAEVTGELMEGRWHDVGTPERLKKLNESFQRRIKTIEYDGKL